MQANAVQGDFKTHLIYMYFLKNICEFLNKLMVMLKYKYDGKCLREVKM